MKNSNSLLWKQKQVGRNSQNKVASCVSCPNVSIKHLNLEGSFKISSSESWRIISTAFLLAENDTLAVYKLYTTIFKNI